MLLSPQFGAGRSIVAMVGLASVCACSSEPPEAAIAHWDQFPLELGRAWEYSNVGFADVTLVARNEGQHSEFDGGRVYTISYEKKCLPDVMQHCEDDPRWTIRWSSSATFGVRIHAVVANGEVAFEPPIQLASPRTMAGEVVETHTDRGTWASTFLGVSDCDDSHQGLARDCSSFLLEPTQPDDSGLSLQGISAATGVGPVTLDFGEGSWHLVQVDCGACDGVW